MDWTNIFDKKKLRKSLGQDEPFDRSDKKGDEGYERMKKEYVKREDLEKQKKADKEKYGYEHGGIKKEDKKPKSKFDKLKKLLRTKK